METVEKYAVLMQSRFFDFFKFSKTLKSRNRFWVPECNLRFLQKLFDRRGGLSSDLRGILFFYFLGKGVRGKGFLGR